MQIRSAKFWAIISVAAVIVVVGLPTAKSLSTTGATAKHPAAELRPAKAEVEETKYEITPHPSLNQIQDFLSAQATGVAGGTKSRGIAEG